MASQGVYAFLDTNDDEGGRELVELPSNANYLATRGLDSDSDATNSHRHSNTTSLVIRYALCVALLCTLLNILSSGWRFTRYTIAGLLSDRPLPDLEFASAYIGLENAYRDSHSDAISLPTIVNYPMKAVVINSQNPDQAYVDEARIAYGPYGTVYSEHRYISVSPSNSTFVQFYAGDFGMERCALEIRVPPSDATPERQDVVPGKQTIPGGFASVQVWSVHASRPLDVSEMSWAHRPRKEAILASWEVAYNATFLSDEFACPSLTFPTFELVCNPEADERGCVLNFNQIRDYRDLGVWLVQRSSL
ncbi:hypothetical protein C8Q80DRAFT_816687 [Daedaleopsis nitida]|nr:hypothetical protein C8Q80DRAFT_816687 [Daedaleopsis nitida]